MRYQELIKGMSIEQVVELYACRKVGYSKAFNFLSVEHNLKGSKPFVLLGNARNERNKELGLDY